MINKVKKENEDDHKESIRQMLTCPVCEEEMSPNNLETLDCNHIWHPSCLRKFLEAETKKGNLLIPCPMCQREDKHDQLIKDSEIRIIAPWL